ncbi:MAG: hypothetical protein F6J97_07830 [Leptolyngbya sp. SIO4C1]|nr:hypothetical protein [Leptolyngbya sp. SIO4C1]
MSTLFKPTANRSPLSWLQALYTSAWGMPILFACLGLLVSLRRSMWRDEMNVWLIARDSQSIGELFTNIHYDRGHPPVWHLLVAGTELLFNTPIAMQLLHWLIAVGAVAIFWRYSPFPRWVKTLFIFGYLPFYEFHLVARNYGIGMLLLFAVCAVFPQRHRTYLPIAILLVLAANTNMYAALVALPLTLMLGLELMLSPRQRRAYFQPAKAYDWILSAAILVAGYAIAIHYILPPSDAAAKDALGSWFLQFDLRHFLRSLGRWFGAYFLIIPTHKRWLDLIFCDSVVLAIIGLTILSLLRKPFPLLFYTVANGLLLGFTYFKFLGRGLRHYGHFYLIWVIALWLASYYRPQRRFKLGFLSTWSEIAKPWQRRAFILVLCVQFLGGIGRFTLEGIQPLSASRAAASYIQQTQLQDELIVASRDANMAALSGYLNRQFYYPQTQAMGSYTLFFKGNRREVEQPETLQQTQQLLEATPQRDRILLILHDALEVAVPPALSITPIAEFKEAQETTERYYLYWAELSD